MPFFARPTTSRLQHIFVYKLYKATKVAVRRAVTANILRRIYYWRYSDKFALLGTLKGTLTHCRDLTNILLPVIFLLVLSVLQNLIDSSYHVS